MKIKRKQIISILIILIIGIGFITISSAYTGTGFSHKISYSKYSNLSKNEILDNYNNTTCRKELSGICTKVVDGDTIYVEGVGKIRFVGVNTPERGVEGYNTSKNFVKKLCLNKKVSLDVDDYKKSDKYGRTLAVVIIDNKNLNEMLLKENLAEIMYILPSEFNPYQWESNVSNIYKSISIASKPSSINTGYSINKDSGSNSDVSKNRSKYIGSKNSNKFHDPSCKWAKKISDYNKITFNNRNDAIKQGYQPCKFCNP